jgi:hypothetical protein
LRVAATAGDSKADSKAEDIRDAISPTEEETESIKFKQISEADNRKKAQTDKVSDSDEEMLGADLGRIVTSKVCIHK